ncbi:unnamed protein product, partial [Amoebophrya sp. A25]
RSGAEKNVLKQTQDHQSALQDERLRRVVLATERDMEAFAGALESVSADLTNLRKRLAQLETTTGGGPRLGGAGGFGNEGAISSGTATHLAP